MTPADIARLWTLAQLDAARRWLSAHEAMTADLYAAIRAQQDAVRAACGLPPERGV